MKVLVSGASGLIGNGVTTLLEARGDTVFCLVRRHVPEDPRAVFWDPARGAISRDDLEGFDAVIHLAGENIADGRWTEEKKKRIHESRVLGTQLLSDALAQAHDRPKVLVSASAIGFYGSRGDEELDESSGPGEGFLADVCKSWEAAAVKAGKAGIRVVHPRISVVLSRAGGALPKMLLPFKLGLGGPIGSGAQYMSWISLDDAAAALIHCVDHAELDGPVNFMTPNPVPNKEFTRVLASVLRRPAFLPVPAFALKAAMGEMADEMLLSSVRALPRKLQSSGFEFQDPHLEPALRRILGR